jgi:TonB family protein
MESKRDGARDGERDGPMWRRGPRAGRPALGHARGVAGCCALAVLVACGSGGSDDYVEDPLPMPDPSPIEYPIALWDERVEGETEVMIHVNEFGDVDSVFVSKPSGHAEFDTAAVRGARQLRFTPGRRGDRRVAMWTRMPIRFSQDSTAAIGEPTASGITP